MSETLVARLAAFAVQARSEQHLLESFIAAAEGAAMAERLGDVRDGLLDMPLPFRSAQKLGVDANGLLARAEGHLTERSRELLREFAVRPDRDDIEAMGYAEGMGLKDSSTNGAGFRGNSVATTSRSHARVMLAPQGPSAPRPPVSRVARKTPRVAREMRERCHE
ncbi:MAG: hypothetical protein H0V20_08230 [Actinobacteria bacterium]|nr:hypothetical protein [Actinomycetota bacterium]